MSFYRFLWSVFPLVVIHRGFFGKPSSGIRVTWQVHLNCAHFRRECTLCILALFRTSVSGIMSYKFSKTTCIEVV